MRTQLDEASASLTTQEAEAVLQLWAKRQGEVDSLRARMSVQDIAEAISVPPSEVDAMLREVRRNQSLPPVELPSIETRKRRNQWLIAIATVVWVGLLAVGILAAYAEGRASARGIDANTLATRYEDLRAPAVTPALPTGVSVSFRGYTLDGTKGGIVSEMQIAAAIRSVIDKVAGPPQHLGDPPAYPATVIHKALLEESAAGAESALKFEELRVSFGQQSRVVNMPIALTDDQTVVSLVEDEQRRKIGILANQTQRFSDKE